MHADQTSSIQHLLAALLGLKRIALYSLLCLLLLSVQSLELTHNHAGELQAQFDCDICMKLSSLEDLIVSDNFTPLVTAAGEQFETLLQSQLFSATPALKARAPPITV